MDAAPAVTPLDHALHYAARGWRVAPIPAGLQHPGRDDWQNAATTDATTIRRWYSVLGAWRRGGAGFDDLAGYGVCIVTGRASGIFVVDVDRGHGDSIDGQDTLDDLQATYGPLPDTVEAITGRGGRHLYFRYPDGVEIRNSAGNVLGPGLDVRGEGGQVVAPPSISAKSGQPYVWETLSDPLEGIAVAEAPDWLIALLTAEPAPRTPRRAPPVGDSRPIGDLAPGERFEAENDWADLLGADGWQLFDARRSARGGDGYELWTRPGKDRREGASASLYYGGSDVLKVFTSNAPGLAQDATYTRFGYWAATRYGGDHSAAASALRREYGDRCERLNMIEHKCNDCGHAWVPAPDEETDDDWAPIDLATIAEQMLAGQWNPIAPEILHVAGAMPLFYKGRINSLFGESGGGKTWVAIMAAAEQLRLGRAVLFVDYEDSAAGITERLLDLGLGVTDIKLLDYVNPVTGVGFGLKRLEAHLASYELVIVDSTGEAMAAGGVDPNSDAEVARWFTIIKGYARLGGGPAVVVLDHVPKDKDAPSSYAIGSQRKRAAVTGASYRVDTIKEPARGKDGKLKLSVAKDRIGHRARGTTAAIIDIESGDGGAVAMTAHITEAQEAAARGARFRPTALMERLSRWIEINPAQPKSAVLKEVTGKRETLLLAFDVLVDEGWVTTTLGDRNAVRCNSARPFREVDDDGNGPRGELVPASSLSGSGTSSPPPPPRRGGELGDNTQEPPPSSPDSSPAGDEELDLY